MGKSQNSTSTMVKDLKRCSGVCHRCEDQAMTKEEGGHGTEHSVSSAICNPVNVSRHQTSSITLSLNMKRGTPLRVGVNQHPDRNQTPLQSQAPGRSGSGRSLEQFKSLSFSWMNQPLTWLNLCWKFRILSGCKSLLFDVIISEYSPHFDPF